jgi:hypothetical protein
VEQGAQCRLYRDILKEEKYESKNGKKNGYSTGLSGSDSHILFYGSHQLGDYLRDDQTDHSVFRMDVQLVSGNRRLVDTLAGQDDV